MSILDDAEYDREKFCLGKLCKRGHDWQDSGKSLRNIKNHHCDDCRRFHEAANKEHLRSLRNQWKEENRERVVQQNRESYLRNRELVLSRGRQRYQENREEILAQTSAYQKTHQEQNRESTRRWKERNPGRQEAYYQANRERLLESGRRYYRLNKDKTLARKRRRRARKANATTITPTASAIRLLFERCNHRCVYCGCDRELALEHFISLYAGGTDCIGNLSIACKSCNSSKGTKDPYQWFQTRSTFSQKR